MQYQITQQVHAPQWENEQTAVIAEMQRRAQHDLEVQNPGSTITIDKVEHAVRANQGVARPTEGSGSYLVDFVFEYTVSGQTNTFAA
ncbi:MAG: hypothetical protein M3R24_41120 [Chloroflexota bacterium]|nr:hypothetical protein [Chloroflexota bacterium]PLS77471.1 MAG: hypothetical protein CYG59_23635 [Chloroflexota bacterium]